MDENQERPTTSKVRDNEKANAGNSRFESFPYQSIQIIINRGRKDHTFDTQVTCIIKPQNSPKYTRKDMDKLAGTYIFRVHSNYQLDEDSERILEENKSNQRKLSSMSKYYTQCLQILKDVLKCSTYEELEDFQYPRLAADASIAERKMYRVMKHVLFDFSSKCFRQFSAISNHERTFFVDRIVPIFNYVQDHCGLIQFEWFVPKQLGLYQVSIVLILLVGARSSL